MGLATFNSICLFLKQCLLTKQIGLFFLPLTPPLLKTRLVNREVSQPLLGSHQDPGHMGPAALCPFELLGAGQ
jgi:hypothetical protein